MPERDIAASGIAGVPANARSAIVSTASSPEGLTSKKAESRLAKIGPNSALHPMRLAVAKLWAPVPWMLEAAIILELMLHKFAESAIKAALLVFNAALGFFQEGSAQGTGRS